MFLQFWTRSHPYPVRGRAGGGATTAGRRDPRLRDARRVTRLTVPGYVVRERDEPRAPSSPRPRAGQRHPGAPRQGHCTVGTRLLVLLAAICYFHTDLRDRAAAMAAANRE